MSLPPLPAPRGLSSLLLAKELGGSVFPTPESGLASASTKTTHHKRRAGPPWGLSSGEPTCRCRSHRLDP